MKRQIWFLVLEMGVVMATKVLTFVIGMMFLMMLRSLLENPILKI